MFSPRSDSVTNIHKRWSVTRVNPSSYKISLAISLLSATIIIILSHIYITQSQNNLAFYIIEGLAAILALNFLDFLTLYGTPMNKLSKLFHVSAFANLLWSATLLSGIALGSLLSKSNNSTGYLLEGMLLVTAFRIAIFTSVFGSGNIRATLVAFIQPMIFSVVLLKPYEFYSNLMENTVSIVFGSSFVILAIIWSVVADRAGRPYVRSTFNLLQAFLAAWTEKKAEKMEEIAESKASKKVVVTQILKFRQNDHDDHEDHEFSLLLPGIHPGPFNPIGGSDLPYVLYKFFSKKAIVLHSVSDHSLNIPSKKEVEKYLKSLTEAVVFEKSSTCSHPVQTRINKCTATGIGFGDIATIMLSMAPQGMEDVPADIRLDLENYAYKLGLSQILVIDTHNGMGGPLGEKEKQDLLSCAKKCLEKIRVSEQYNFRVGFASSEHSLLRKKKNDKDNNKRLKEDVGQAGLAMFIIEVKSKTYALGWADSNNIQNGVLDSILSYLNANGINIMEICTSDTHSTSGKRTRHGYYALGSITDRNQIARIFFELAEKAIAHTRDSTFELLSADSYIKVMGKNQFDDYSNVLDRSVNITKVFLTLSVVLSICMLIYT